MMLQKIEKVIAARIIGTIFEHKTYIVGGYVRDQLMGKNSEDMDIVVELKNGGIKLANFLFEHGISTSPVVFDKFGTSQIEIKDHKIELVMTRKEFYRTKNRKPIVQFADLKEDVYRRDFTINSLLKDIVSGEIIDLTQKGVSDINNKIIRTTHDSDSIFKDDPLRMLRAIRFSIQLAFEIEKETYVSIQKNAEELEHISQERKRDELIKILINDKPETGIKLLIESDLMEYIIPELSKLCQDRSSDGLLHTFKMLSNVNDDIILRLASLLVDIKKTAKIVLKRLKIPNKIIKTIVLLLDNLDVFEQYSAELKYLDRKTIIRYILDYNDNLEYLLQFIHAHNLSQSKNSKLEHQIPMLQKRIEKIENKYKINMLPINGNDIILHYGIKEGKKVGKLLRDAKEIWLEHPDWDKDKILRNLTLRRQHER